MCARILFKVYLNMSHKDLSNNNISHECSLKEVVENYLRQFVKKHEGALPEGELYDLVIQQVEKPLIDVCLEICDNNQTKTAQLLGMNRNTLKKKIQLYEHFCGKIDK